MNGNKDWTDKLPELLEGFTEAEPEGLWDAVASGIQPKKKRVIPFWWYVAGAAVAAAAIAAVAIFQPAAPSTDEIIAPVPGIPVIADVEDTPQVDLPGSDLVPRSVPRRSRIDTPPVANEEEAIVDIVVPDEIIEDVPEDVIEDTPVDVVEVVPEDVADVVPEETAEDNTPDKPVVDFPDVAVIEPITEKVRRPLSVQFLLGLNGHSQQPVASRTTGIGIPSVPGYRASMVPDTKAVGKDMSVAAAMLSRNKPSTTDAVHTQSARWSLGFLVGLDNHWGVETGIISTTLNSTFNTTSGSGRSTTTRDVTYTGIPLYVRYSVLNWNKIGLYVNAGPMYEFTSRTREETLSYIGNESNATNKEVSNTLYSDRKWSLNAGAGLQLQVLPHGALYVQPGVSYHFPDNSALQTYYTEHPFSFNITFGYRFYFSSTL